MPYMLSRYLSNICIGCEDTWVPEADSGGIHLPCAAHRRVPECLLSPAKGCRAAGFLQKVPLLRGQGQGNHSKAFYAEAWLRGLSILKAACKCTCSGKTVPLQGSED